MPHQDEWRLVGHHPAGIVKSMMALRPEVILPLDVIPVLTLVSLRAVSLGYHVSPPALQIDAACGSLVNHICSHDGKSKCECRLVVLELGSQENVRLPLVFHGHHSATEIYLSTDQIKLDNPGFLAGVRALLNEEAQFANSIARQPV